MTTSVNKQEAECQTILQCTPHILGREEVAIVQSDGSCQTEVSCAPDNSNTKLFPLLSYTKPEDIQKDAIRKLYLPRIPRLQFALPNESSELLDLESVSNVNSPRDSLEITTDYESPIGEQTDEERPSSMNDVDTPEYDLGEVEDGNSRSLKTRAVFNRSDKGTSSDDVRIQSILKGSINYGRRKKRKKRLTEDATCQTSLMVAPHIITSSETAVVTSNLSVQTSVTCHPECSVSDIIPKLKSYLVHEGTQAAPTSGDNKNNASVLDLIKELIDEVENSHVHLFDPTYIPPVIPAQLVISDIVPQKVKHIDKSKENEIDSPKKNYIDFLKENNIDSSNENYIDISSKTELNEPESLKSVENKTGDVKQEMLEQAELAEPIHTKPVKQDPEEIKAVKLKLGSVGKIKVDLEDVNIRQMILDIANMVNLIPKEDDLVKVEEKIATLESDQVYFVKLVEDIVDIVKVEPEDSEFVAIIEEIADAVHLKIDDTDIIKLVEEIDGILKTNQEDASANKFEPNNSEDDYKNGVINFEIDKSAYDELGTIKTETKDTIDNKNSPIIVDAKEIIPKQELVEPDLTEDNIGVSRIDSDLPIYVDKWKENNVIDTIDLTDNETVSSTNNEVRKIISVLIDLATKVSKPQITDERQKEDVMDIISSDNINEFSIQFIISNFVAQQNLNQLLFNTNFQLNIVTNPQLRFTQLPKESNNETPGKQNDKPSINTKVIDFQYINQPGSSGICSSVINNNLHFLYSKTNSSSALHQTILNNTNSLPNISKNNLESSQTVSDNFKCPINTPKKNHGKVSFKSCSYSRINLSNDCSNSNLNTINSSNFETKHPTPPNVCSWQNCTNVLRTDKSKNYYLQKQNEILQPLFESESVERVTNETKNELNLNSSSSENCSVPCRMQSKAASDFNFEIHTDLALCSKFSSTSLHLNSHKERNNKQLEEEPDLPSNINQIVLKIELESDPIVVPVRKTPKVNPPTSTNFVVNKPNTKRIVKQFSLKEKSNLSYICQQDIPGDNKCFSTDLDIQGKSTVEEILSSKSLACVCKSGYEYPIRVHCNIDLHCTKKDSYCSNTSIQCPESDTVIDILLPRSRQFMSTIFPADPEKLSSSQGKVKMELKGSKKEEALGNNVCSQNEPNCKKRILLTRPKSAPVLTCKCKPSSSETFPPSISSCEPSTKLVSSPVTNNIGNLCSNITNTDHVLDKHTISYDSYKMTMDNSKSSSSVIPKPDPVFLAMATCETEFRPIKQALQKMQQKLKTLNMPELDLIFNTETAFKKKMNSFPNPNMKYKTSTCSKQNQTEFGTSLNSGGISNQYKSFTTHSSPTMKYTDISNKFVHEFQQNYANQISPEIQNIQRTPSYQNNYSYSLWQSSYRGNCHRTFPIAEETISSKQFQKPDLILKTKTAFKNKLESFPNPNMKYKTSTCSKQYQTEFGTSSNSDGISNQYKSFTTHSSPTMNYTDISNKFTHEFQQNYPNQISPEIQNIQHTRSYQNNYSYSLRPSSYLGNCHRTFPIAEETLSSKQLQKPEMYGKHQNGPPQTKHLCHHKDASKISHSDRKSQKRAINQSDRDEQGSYYENCRAGPSNYFRKHNQPYYDNPSSYNYDVDTRIRSKPYSSSNSRERCCCRKLKKTPSKTGSSKKRKSNTCLVKSSESLCPCWKVLKSLLGTGGKSENKNHKNIGNLRVHSQFRTKQKRNE